MSDLAICPTCCHRASAMCSESCSDGPVVHCTRYDTVTKAPVVLAAACSLCLGNPPPGETCRLCGGQGAPFLATEADSGWTKPHEFQINDQGEVERLRAEVEWLRQQIREALVVAETTNPALALMLREALQ